MLRDSVLLDAPYPSAPLERNRWITLQRGTKNRLDPARPYAFLHEDEAGVGGEMISTATIFLTNRECPFRCLMCDLWRDTLDEPTPPGAIPAQIAYALDNLPSCRQIKLYNAGSFFDPGAIPPADHAAIVERIQPFERVIVECHPALVNDSCVRFAAQIKGQLEIAMGLETVHPEVLARLNKRMTVESFTRAASFLRAHTIDLRVFILVRPPFLSENEGIEWAKRSLDVAFDAGATVCSLIPTRAGNGAMDTLQKSGHFTPPSLSSLEEAHRYGLELSRKQGRGARVFADLWDIERFFTCECCSARATRLAHMNNTQTAVSPEPCPLCAGTP